MIITVRTILNVGDSLQSFGKTPTKYRTAVKANLVKQYPGVTGVEVSATHHEADIASGEPYTSLIAEGQWDDGKTEG